MTQLPPSAANSAIRILIVEDEDTLRESCASVLSHDGYCVTTSGVAQEAYDLLEPAAEIAAQDIPFLNMPAPASDRPLGLEHKAGTGYNATSRDRARKRRRFGTRV